MLVATSGLDIYEKYSPANYKPNCDPPSRCSSVVNDELETTIGGVGSDSTAATTTHITLDRPRSRYSRLYSNDSTDGASDNVKVPSSPNLPRSSSSRRSATKLTHSASAGGLSSSGSSSDVTYTLRGNRLTKHGKESKESKEETLNNNNNDLNNNTSLVLKNGMLADFTSSVSSTSSSATADTNGIDTKLRKLKLSESKDAENTKSEQNQEEPQKKYKIKAIITTDDDNKQNGNSNNNTTNEEENGNNNVNNEEDDNNHSSVTLKLGSKVTDSKRP